MRLLMVAIVFLWAEMTVFAQDREEENEFFRLKDKIKEYRIIEIRKMYAQNPCSGIKSPEASYKFDHSGNLILMSKYSNFVLEKMIAYTRNDRGDYDSKIYTFFDTTGKPSSEEPWVFEYDARGRRIRETWNPNNRPGRVNILSYDDKGRIVEQTADSMHKWTFRYDNEDKLIERQEWELGDSTRLIDRILYGYVNAKVNFEMFVTPEDNGIWKARSYVYDRNQNVIEENGHVWLRQSGGLRERVEFRTIYEYDALGQLLTERSFSRGETEPWRCVVYEYVYGSR